MVSQTVQRILENRGMTPDQIDTFLNPDYEAHLHDPFLMLDMDRAVDRIVMASERGETVAVYGDYDIDGITASAVMIEALAALGIGARSYIPDRFEEGYGINRAALELLKGQGVQLVISVDCGITSVAEAQWARDNGLDLIITDHHAVPPELPPALAVVNPKRPGDPYPFKDLAGAGVAFKVAQALQRRSGKPAAGQEKWLLDLVAYGTVCDIVTLVDENRVIVSYGLKVMRRTRRVGLRALALVGGVDIAEISSHHLGFVLGPRMNAAGRLDHAARSVELVMTSDAGRAQAIAAELDEMNHQRRADQATIFAAADRLAEQYADDPVLVLASADWSHGVVGIVASKLVEKWQKPTLVAQVLGEHTKGSARSAGAYNMVEALRANAGLLQKFGGHFHAAGYTLATDRIDDLRSGLNRYWYEQGIAAASAPVPTGEVALGDLGEVSLALLAELAVLEPHGSANPRPTFELSGLQVSRLARIGKDKTHLRLTLRDRAGKNLAAIGFGLYPKHPRLAEGQRVRLVGDLNKNEYQGSTTLQLVISDLQYE